MVDVIFCYVAGFQASCSWLSRVFRACLGPGTFPPPKEAPFFHQESREEENGGEGTWRVWDTCAAQDTLNEVWYDSWWSTLIQYSCSHAERRVPSCRNHRLLWLFTLLLFVWPCCNASLLCHDRSRGSSMFHRASPLRILGCISSEWRGDWLRLPSDSC